MLTTGKKVPAFSLPDQDGKAVALESLAGKWVVLYFYPRDDTPGCTVEACEFTAQAPAFARLGAEVFGCSADGATAHQKFIQKHELGIRLLTDADKKVMRSYGAFGEKVMYGKKVEGVIRSTVLIAPDGTLAHHWPKVQAAGHAEAVRQRLAALVKGEPADAAPGKKPAAKAGAKTAPAKKAAAAKSEKKPVRKAAKKPGK